jgi:hypothetical protein
MTPADVELMTKKVDAERRRIRREIAPAIKALRSILHNGGDWYEFRDSLLAIDRATKVPKRETE